MKKSAILSVFAAFAAGIFVSGMVSIQAKADFRYSDTQLRVITRDGKDYNLGKMDEDLSREVDPEKDSDLYQSRQDAIWAHRLEAVVEFFSLNEGGNVEAVKYTDVKTDQVNRVITFTDLTSNDATGMRIYSCDRPGSSAKIRNDTKPWSVVLKGKCKLGSIELNQLGQTNITVKSGATVNLGILSTWSNNMNLKVEQGGYMSAKLVGDEVPTHAGLNLVETRMVYMDKDNYDDPYILHVYGPGKPAEFGSYYQYQMGTEHSNGWEFFNVNDSAKLYKKEYENWKKGNDKDTSDQKISTPKSLSIKSGSKKITVSWKKQSKNTTGYEIQYSTDKKFKNKVKKVTVKGASKKSVTIKKLKTKTTYYVRIRAYNKKNGKTTYSKWSNAKKCKTK